MKPNRDLKLNKKIFLNGHFKRSENLLLPSFLEKFSLRLKCLIIS